MTLEQAEELCRANKVLDAMKIIEKGIEMKMQRIDKRTLVACKNKSNIALYKNHILKRL